MDYKITYMDSPETYLVDKIEKMAREEINSKGFFSIAFSGGRTPLKLYEMLVKSSIEWKKVHIFMVDERYVGMESGESNYGQLNSSLLSKIDVPPENIHLIRTDFEIEKAATAYEDELKRFFKKVSVPFDIILLGIGMDGHTASIFPENGKLFETEKRVVITSSERYRYKRISLSLNAMQDSENIVFIIKGEKKKRAIEAFLKKKEFYVPFMRVISKSVNCEIVSD